MTFSVDPPTHEAKRNERDDKWFLEFLSEMI